ncbi:MAG: hypothetical protein FJ292_06755 [Planctomycetes bacterium]|nr:hypothetical protein [Planctomycetota bacterium]
MMLCGAILRRFIPPLASLALVGCVIGGEPAPEPAAPQLLPFTYAARQDGARMGLREGEGMPHVRCVFEDSRGRV